MLELIERLEKAEDRVRWLEEALLNIALRDHHYRKPPSPKPDGGLRGWAGHHAIWALTGQNGSYVNDGDVLAELEALRALRTTEQHSPAQQKKED